MSKKKKAVKKTVAPAKAKKRAAPTRRRASVKKEADPLLEASTPLEVSQPEPAPEPAISPGERLDKHELAEALNALSGLLVPYAHVLECQVHPELGFGLMLPPDESGEQLFFGGVSVRGEQVRFSLPPLVQFPQLLQLVSQDLLAFLHEGQHFYFARHDPALLEELAALARACYEHLREVERV